MKRVVLLFLITLLILLTCSNLFSSIIIQYYESKWQTIEHRLPDIFIAGYDYLWVPPPGKADTGGYSVGYDIWDRFHLGKPYDQTLYGTEESLKTLINRLNRAGSGCFIDLCLNHNGFRDSSTPGFGANGYPGFRLWYSFDIDGDFHGAYESGRYNERVSGLIDIAQEKGDDYFFIRHPIEDNPDNLEGATIDTENARLYPDSDPSGGDEVTWSGFNLTNPYGGDPYTENATGLLLRYVKWMNEVIGADGFRIDAEKHIPEWFFDSFYDGALYENGKLDLDGNRTTPFSFGEVFDGDFGLLSGYIRKDGYGNRDVLDFPLYFTMVDELNGTGLGSWNNIIYSSIDGSDGDSNDGSRGVEFVQSHDSDKPSADNLAYAFTLLRVGFPIVYFNAKEFGDGRDFPKDGRGDALGGEYGTIITTLVDIHNEYSRGSLIHRSVDSNVYIFERDNNLIVGLNDNSDGSVTIYDERTIYTGFTSETVLKELTGNATNPTLDPSDEIFDSVTVQSDSSITIRVPRNHQQMGYVAYGLANPQGTLTISPVSDTIPPDSSSVPNGIRRIAEVDIITADSFTVQLQTTSEVSEDNALIRLDGGLDINDNPGLDFGEGNSVIRGFEQFTTHNSPRHSGGTGLYQQTIDATSLSEGYHFVKVIAFTPRPWPSPETFNTFKRVVYIDRSGPEMSLIYPTNTGNKDITTSDYQAVVKCLDKTANSVHIFWDQPSGADLLSMIGSQSQASWVDRDEFRYNLSGITNGDHSIDIVAFEDSGNYSITRYENINAEIQLPEMAFGIDTDLSVNSVTFEDVPTTIDYRAYENDFVVRVDISSGLSFASGDFTVQLIVDDTTYDAVVYNPSLLPPINRLVQNDQNLSDDYDEFRFVWRGYSKGTHNLIAKAKLTSEEEPNQKNAIIEVLSSTVGPDLTINSPIPPDNSIPFPPTLEVKATTDATAGSLMAFIDNNGDEELIQTVNNPGTGMVTLSTPVDNPLTPGVKEGIELSYGMHNIRVLATTGENGTGIITEDSTTLEILTMKVMNWDIYK